MVERMWRAAALAAACALAAPAIFARPAWSVPTSLSVAGDVSSPGVYDQAALQALPSATQSVTYQAAGSPVSDTFTGPTVWTLLQAAGGITTDPAIKNDILQKYAVATGADGYQAVISAGEVSPRFGNKHGLVAIADTANRLPAPDGFARIVATGDVAGGRYVSNLTSLTAATAPAQPGTGGGPTTQFAVQGGVATPMTFTLPALQALTPDTETVSYLSGTTPVTDTYTGALLWDVLGAAGVQTNPAIKNDLLRKLVTATGSDGYNVDFSLGELSPSFGNEPILVAYADTGGQIAGGAGFARIVVPGDIAGGRYVSSLSSLTVFDGTAVPEPASLVLVTTGLAGAVLLRRKRPACRETSAA